MEKTAIISIGMATSTVRIGCQSEAFGTVGEARQHLEKLGYKYIRMAMGETTRETWKLEVIDDEKKAK